MITAQYLNEQKEIISEAELSFVDMIEEVYDQSLITGVVDLPSILYSIYSYKEATILILSRDDLVAEFNIDAFRQYPELKDGLKKIYTDIPIDLYIDIQTELPNFVSSTLKPFTTSADADFFRINCLQSITFGEGSNEETYNVDTTPFGDSYDVQVSATNLDSSMLLVSLIPEHNPIHFRHNFRNVAELTDYIISFATQSSEGTKFYSGYFMTLLSYSKYRRDF